MEPGKHKQSRRQRRSYTDELVGPNAGGGVRGRARTRVSLDSLDSFGWDAESAHAADGLCAIDLVGGPKACRVGAPHGIEPARESDHAGYVVEIFPPGGASS